MSATRPSPDLPPRARRSAAPGSRLTRRCGRYLLLLPLLAGCGDYSGDYPALLPTDQLLAEPAIPGHAQIAASTPDQVMSDLQSAGAALSVSSAAVTAAGIANAPDISDRAAALRDRADALSRSNPSCDDPYDPATC